ncbi:LytTR family transcriptional regulator DNA-binding domain-containing protein [Paenibacillus thermoaerophilus]|uniref:LytTR family transcriptional regulator DNA-binding domain-containing protein n=1 Tax=Paenibacillus thermoaerophilus TaxID=1215385 RepID=A0ABW2V1J1_9BACL|nr:LytTR family transcriptional regulator DNA-binding domain-containing protein [Paenibacillus thermoaerophilus]TMV16026.1 LytTR family transcriptional regulator [Paenibacillus thermoaerophilus]
MKFPVTRDRNNETEYVMLDAEDVLYIHLEDRTVVFHTHEGKFYLLDTLSALAKHMEALGFRKLDRVNLVNVKKITQFDDEQGKVYFDATVDKNSDFATVSFVNKNTYRKEILHWVEKNSKK